MATPRTGLAGSDHRGAPMEYETDSILKLIERRFDLAPLSDRDAISTSMILHTPWGTREEDDQLPSSRLNPGFDGG